ncbi:MAG: hypothetical protein ACWA5P_14155 [bacterium]
MKNSNLILALLLVFAMFACEQNTSTTESQTTVEEVSDEPSLVGVWELTSFINYDADGVADTIPATATNKQIKMYTEHKIMWSRFNEADSVDWFGYGDYKVVDGELSETLEYGSKSMNKAIEEEAEFVFQLIIDKDNFSQVTIDEEGHAIFAENYHRIQD